MMMSSRVRDGISAVGLNGALVYLYFVPGSARMALISSKRSF